MCENALALLTPSNFDTISLSLHIIPPLLPRSPFLLHPCQTTVHAWAVPYHLLLISNPLFLLPHLWAGSKASWVVSSTHLCLFFLFPSIHRRVVVVGTTSRHRRQNATSLRVEARNVCCIPPVACRLWLHKLPFEYFDCKFLLSYLHSILSPLSHFYFTI